MRRGCSQACGTVSRVEQLSTSASSNVSGDKGLRGLTFDHISSFRQHESSPVSLAAEALFDRTFQAGSPRLSSSPAGPSVVLALGYRNGFRSDTSGLKRDPASGVGFQKATTSGIQCSLSPFPAGLPSHLIRQAHPTSTRGKAAVSASVDAQSASPSNNRCKWASCRGVQSQFGLFSSCSTSTTQSVRYD